MPIKSANNFPREIAIVHEWFTPRSVGGAEKVVRVIDNHLRDIGSIVDLVALVDGESSLKSSWLYKRKIKTSFIQKLPWGISHVQNYLPLLPLAIEQIDLQNYPIIISSNHLVAKGILTSPDQLHVSYVHTPVRYAWDQMNTYLRQSYLARAGFGPLIRWQLHKLRQWDQLSAIRTKYILANSRFTSRRIKHYWGVESEVLHPPVDVNRFTWDNDREDFYLCVSRLVPNKRIDILVKVFTSLELPLIIIGDGPQKKYLKSIAGENIKIIGSQSNQKVSGLMSRCRAFVYAGLEDFGIAPVEAMASGAPVIALGQGGLLDSVRCINKNHSSPTGLLFKEQTTRSLSEAIVWFEEKKLWRSFDSHSIRLWSERFRKEAFVDKFEKILNKAWKLHQNSLDVSIFDPDEIVD